MSAEDSLKFYKDIRSFDDFSKITDESYFLDVPANWFVVLSDVKGSTKAIQEGRYKQVNVIGAASITCVVNCLKQYEFPFVFGGDGATMLLPPEHIEEVKVQLIALQKLSLKDFALELRVGIVPVSTLYKEGHLLKIGKYELSPGNYLAQFRGSALTRAEDLVKKVLPGAEILTADEKSGPPELTGLSCRLNPLRSKNGVILSILGKPVDESKATAVVKEMLLGIRTILKDDFKSASPVSQKNLSWKLIPDSLADEVRLSRKSTMFLVHFFKTLLWILTVNASMLFEFSLGPFKPKKYKAELVLNSDFKKFDETLRMVIDCTLAQADAISTLLEYLYKQKKVYYGIHKSEEALMTCVVYSASQNHHIHFIDGSDGGYALAASGMKRQMK